MTSFVYNKAKEAFLKALLPDLSAAGTTIKVMLVGSNYSSLAQETCRDTHQYKSDIDGISGAEITGTGYTAGGQALTTKAFTLDTTNDKAYVDADDPSWAASTISATGAIIYVDTGTASTSRLLRYIDFGGTKSSTSGAFTLQLPADGWIYGL